MRYNDSSSEGEEGLLLVKRNVYGNLEYFPVGEWRYSFSIHGEKLVANSFFDIQYGDRGGKSYYLKGDTLSLECEHHRAFRNDSLVETQKWYYPNGNLRAELYYLIQRGYRPEKKDWERIKRVGEWKMYTEEGRLKKRKQYN